jgi:hypothetical protein
MAQQLAASFGGEAVRTLRPGFARTRPTFPCKEGVLSRQISHSARLNPGDQLRLAASQKEIAASSAKADGEETRKLLQCIARI